MKKRQFFLAALAIALVLCSTIGTSLAYFTTYVTAKGGYIIKSSPEIHEEFTGKNKAITITNAPGASPVFVRVKVLSGSEFEMGFSYDESKWKTVNFEGVTDGYFYYIDPLYGDGSSRSTSVLNAKIEKIPERLKDGDEFNIVVIYEYVLAVFNGNDPDGATSWANGNINIG